MEDLGFTRRDFIEASGIAVVGLLTSCVSSNKFSQISDAYPYPSSPLVDNDSLGSNVPQASGAIIEEDSQTLTDFISEEGTRQAEAPEVDENYDTLYLREMMKDAVSNYNSVLGTQLDPNGISQKVILVDTLKAYQSVLRKNSQDYTPSNELNTPAIATNEGDIIIYREAVERLADKHSSNHNASRARHDIMEQILIHEIVHVASARYKSLELHNLVYGGGFTEGGINVNANQITHRYVMGAEIKAVITGEGAEKDISSYQRLEEVEATIIARGALGRTLEARVVGLIDDMRFGNEIALYDALFDRMGGDKFQHIKELAQLRTVSGGRETWARKIANELGLRGENTTEVDFQLQRGMDILKAIDTNNLTSFLGLTNI